MAQLHHVIIPSSDHLGAVVFLGGLLNIEPEPPTDRFPRSPTLRVGGLKFMFCKSQGSWLHLAFHVTPAEFDHVMNHIRDHDLAHGNGPYETTNRKIRTDDREYGYRAVWLTSPDENLLEFFSFDKVPETFTGPGATITGMDAQ